MFAYLRCYNYSHDYNFIVAKQFGLGEWNSNSSSLVFLISAFESLESINSLIEDYNVKVKLSDYCNVSRALVRLKYEVRIANLIVYFLPENQGSYG